MKEEWGGRKDWENGRERRREGKEGRSKMKGTMEHASPSTNGVLLPRLKSGYEPPSITKKPSLTDS